MKDSILIVAPGRGSYSKNTMGYLQDRPSPSLQKIDSIRKQQHRLSPIEIDALPRFKASKHLAGEEASLLTAACSLADFDDIDRSKYDIIGVCGNSMGHYTALVLSGALSLEEGVHLIDTMGEYQRGNVIGGQLVYPICDANWNKNAVLEAAVSRALQEIPELYLSIRLGFQCILAGSTDAIKKAQQQLPAVEQSGRTFPIILPMHSAFHSPLLQATAARAQSDLIETEWRTPHTSLIDGAGTLWRPLVSHPQEIADYTLGQQIFDTYHFSTMIQNAVSLLAPDKIVLLGPGSNLGGAIVQSLIASGWFGIRNKQDFLQRQKDDPILLSMGRPEQRALLCT